MLLVNRKIFNIQDYWANEYDLKEIAAALGNQCRWGGHTLTWFSVAEHCVRVCREIGNENQVVSRMLKQYGLLHDASEYIYPDLPSPLTVKVPDYRKETVLLQEVIYNYFGLSGNEPEELKVIDIKIRAWEYDNYVIQEGIGWTPAEARFWFIAEARNLGLPFRVPIKSGA